MATSSFYFKKVKDLYKRFGLYHLLDGNLNKKSSIEDVFVIVSADRGQFEEFSEKLSDIENEMIQEYPSLL